MNDQSSANPYEQLHTRLRQLILMRETGPKSAAWHAARMRMIWRLHDELRQAEELESRTTQRVPDQEPADPQPATFDSHC
jgi:hypothetical protein